MSQPCLFQTYSSLFPKPKSTFRELGFRGSALSSGSAFLIPSSRKWRKYLNAPPSLAEHPLVQVKLPNSCHRPSQTIGHLPCYPGCPPLVGTLQPSSNILLRAESNTAAVLWAQQSMSVSLVHSVLIDTAEIVLKVGVQGLATKQNPYIFYVENWFLKRSTEFQT